MKTNTRARRGLRASRGSSLIEVLVSILVVSFGILALGALLSNAAKYNKTTEFRSVATLLASDLADRMRANKVAALALTPSYDLTDAYPDAAGLAAESPPTAADACAVTTACTAAELAAIDLVAWRTALFYGLPGGRGYVLADRALNAVDVWVAWSDPSTSDDTSAVGTCPAGFDTAADIKPRCMYFRVGL